MILTPWTVRHEEAPLHYCIYQADGKQIAVGMTQQDANIAIEAVNAAIPPGSKKVTLRNLSPAYQPDPRKPRIA